MPLTLRVTSFQKGALGQASSKSFAEKGGTIGRVKGNDWVLPDPERIISSRHAVVQFKNGGYSLTDTSANGTFINGAAEAIGNGNQVPLNDGDRVVIGDYEIAVEIAGSVDVDIDIPFNDRIESDDAAFDDGFVSGSGDADVGAADGPLDPLALLGGGGGRSSASSDPIWDVGEEAPLPLSGSTPDDLPGPSQAFTPPGAFAEQIPDDWDLSADDLMPSGAAPPPSRPAAAKPAPPPQRKPQPAPPAPPSIPEIPEFDESETEVAAVVPPPAPPAARPAPSPPVEPAPSAAPAVARSRAGPASDALAAFLDGAGIAADKVAAEQADEFMRLIGQIFRQSMHDLREVLLARASLKSGFRMELTMIRAAENNPLKFAAGGVDEAMQNLLFREGSSYLPPMRAVHEGFQDIKDHQIAMMAGMQAAFRALLERFDPERLERRFEKTGGGWSLLDVQKRSEYWSKFLEEYASVKEQAEEDFQNLFGTDFSRAYEAQIRSLGKARKEKAKEEGK